MSPAAAPRTRSDLVRLLESRGTPFDALEEGPRWAIVTPSLAARILGAGVDEENAFWVSPSPPPAAGAWFNAGGQRTWLAPEGGPAGIFCGMDLAAWTVPPALDPGRFQPAAGPHAWRAELEVRPADGSRHRIGLVRSMTLEDHPGIPGGMLIRFRHELSNRGDSVLNRRISLWGLVQLPCEDEGGAVFVGLSRAGAMPASYFGEMPAPVHGDEGSTAWFGLRGGSRFKAGVSAADFSGTMGFVRRPRAAFRLGELLVTAMSFRVEPAGTYLEHAPSLWPAGSSSGDAAQVYQDPGTGPLAFCEIEAHSPAPRLAPGEAVAEVMLISVARVNERDLSEVLTRGLGLARGSVPAGILPP